MANQYKRYVVTIEIRDGDYEYHSTSQHQLDPQELSASEDPDAYILRDVLGYDVELGWGGSWYETDEDYRHYRLYSYTEITKPKHVKILRRYGIH